MIRERERKSRHAPLIGFKEGENAGRERLREKEGAATFIVGEVRREEEFGYTLPVGGTLRTIPWGPPPYCSR